MFVMLLSDSAAQNVFHDDRSPPFTLPPLALQSAWLTAVIV